MTRTSTQKGTLREAEIALTDAGLRRVSRSAGPLPYTDTWMGYDGRKVVCRVEGYGLSAPAEWWEVSQATAATA